MRTYIICADGACSGNPGPGGYAWEIWDNAVVPGNSIVEGGGQDAHTTNNIMELRAALDALHAVKKLGPALVKLRFDSQYVLKGIFEWMDGWAARGWRTGGGKPVANKEIWEVVRDEVATLDALGFTLEADWVKGHAGNIGNERVDARAVELRDLAKNGVTSKIDDQMNSVLVTEGVVPVIPQGGIDLMAIAEAAGADTDDDNIGQTEVAPVVQAGTNDEVNAEQVALMRAILAGYMTGDSSIKDLIRDVRTHAGKLGC